jgi:hypothetical protein
MTDPDITRIGKISDGSILATLKFVIPRLNEPLPKMDGRGIVTVAGGKYLKYLWMQVKHVRALSDLPIICYHLGPQEIQHPSVEMLEGMGVEFRDALPLMKAEGYTLHGVRGWSAKSIAVKHSPFRHVLFLDADAIPLIDPEEIFAHKDYNTGFLCFGDIAPCRKSNMLFPSLGIRYDKDWIEAEAGQFLVDKQRFWKAIQLYSFMNGRPKPFHDLAYGDKCLLPLACVKLGMPFTQAPKGEWIHYGIRHHLTDGTPAFEHFTEHKRHGLMPDGVKKVLQEFESLTQLQPA